MTTVLILAVAKALSGLSVAGMTAHHEKVTGLRWVRLIRERASIQMADLATHEGRILRPFNVVDLKLLQHHPTPPLIEDWITDFESERPHILRRLEGERRWRFLQGHCDPNPRHVLDSQQRSLCLIKADSVTGSFRRRPDSAAIDARLRFETAGRTYRGSYVKGGLAVTDLQWLALGSRWLPEDGGWTEFDEDMLLARYGIKEIYLVVGLSRSDQFRFEPVVIGVHTVPEYEIPVGTRKSS